MRIIEIRLGKGTIQTLSELEGYFKRMVNNVKDSQPKGSDHWDDAERMRKAGSNYMRAHNPAYASGNYVAVAVSEEQDPNDPDTENDDDADLNGNSKPDGSGHISAANQTEGRSLEDDEKADENGEENEQEDQEGEDEGEDVGLGVEEEEEVEEEEANDDDGDEDDGDDDDGDDDDGDEDDNEEREEDDNGEELVVVKRRGPGRPPKDPEAHAKKMAAKAAKAAAKAAPIDLYKGKHYKGLSFQQAQEKVVEELLRTEDE